jgi:hypothetical protein
VNWRFFGDITEEKFDTLVDDLGAGRLAETVPPHGTLSRVRRTVGLLAGGPTGAGSAPPAEQGAAATSDAPQPTQPDNREAQPVSKASAKRAAKQASQVRKKGDTKPEPGSGERQ